MHQYRAQTGLGFICLLLIACSPELPLEETGATPLAGPQLEDYLRAESFLAPNTTQLVYDQVQNPAWQSDDSLIYRKWTRDGYAYRLALPGSGENLPLFDHEVLHATLEAELEEEIADADFILGTLELDREANTLQFSHSGQRYQLDLDDYSLSAIEAPRSNEHVSPDGQRAVFIQENNLWLRDLTSGELTQLTFDGEPDYGYGTNNAGWIRGSQPVVKWSNDSRSIATFRHDGREVGEMYLYSTRVGHPELDVWKYPLPGDDHIFMIERIVIHLDPGPRIVRLNIPPDSHRSTTADHVADFSGNFLDVNWSADDSSLAFISSSRDHKIAQLRVADVETGAVRDVFREEAETYYESGCNAENWRVFHERDKFIWFSERDNWGHLYLHDLESGEVETQITSGNWPVLQIRHVDLETDSIYFTAAGREGGDPYYHYFYRVHFDGSDLELLTPEPAHHSIATAASGRFFLDSWSTPATSGQAVIRDQQGNVVMELEQTDVSDLVAAGWVAPEPFAVKARDQITDIYGLLYKPSNFDSNQSYPVLNYLYPGPQSGSVGSRAFRPSRNDKQAIAELGFIVVELDAMGTPGRSKSFHDAYYGNMGDNGLPEQVGGIRQLAASRPWMDLDRVGIWGHSGGGFASTAGILRYPEFFKVAVSGAGNHDNRNYEDDWAEKWQGLLVTYEENNPAAGDGSPATNYDNQANQLLADQLQGKLLLAHGMMDSNVHPSNTLLMVEALIDAEKEFDLLVLPNAGHGFGNRRYFMLKRWNYFVEHLNQAQPVTEFRFGENIP